MFLTNFYLTMFAPIENNLGNTGKKSIQDIMVTIAKIDDTSRRRNRQQRCSRWHQNQNVSPIVTQRERSDPQAQHWKLTVPRKSQWVPYHSGLNRVQKNSLFLPFRPWEHHATSRGFVWNWNPVGFTVDVQALTTDECSMPKRKVLFKLCSQVEMEVFVTKKLHCLKWL